MAKNYKEVEWWWYAAILVLSFVLGIIVVTKEHITLPAWAYVVALLLGMFIAPFVSIFTSASLISLLQVNILLL